jgi:CDP-diacylglycerol--glycerol-3-phosphate 3-phosphatidyltransferase
MVAARLRRQPASAYDAPIRALSIDTRRWTCLNEAMTLYALKPSFQNLLRPIAARLAGAGITANQVTFAAALLSVAVGGLLCLPDRSQALFLVLPLWLFLRMALNAIDGMLAREFGQKSRLGGYLNELCDVVSDAALLLPFAFLPPFAAWAVFLVIFLAALSEYAGVMGPLVGASRRYDGPLGKSDRALVVGALGAWIGCGFSLPPWTSWLMPVLALLLIATAVNRVRQGLREP